MRESINKLIKKLSEDIQKDIESEDLRVKGQIAEKTRALAELISRSKINEGMAPAAEDTRNSREMYRKNIILDDEFNKIINVDVRASIAKAFGFLDINSKEGRLPDNIRKEIYERKASQSKTLINEYVDLHVKLALKADCEKDIEK